MKKEILDFDPSKEWDDEIHEACGVFGIFGHEEYDVSHVMYFALYALQHRGQESCGIAISSNGEITGQKGIGLVPEVFTEKVLDRMEGSSAIGHTRYSTCGGSSIENSQPLIFKYKGGKIALAHNGNLVNASKIRAIFQTSTDSEVIANLISRNGLRCQDLEEVIKKTMDVIEGSYALVILTKDKLVGIRDPWGLKPLCLGKLGESYVLSSENCAFDTIGADFIRDIEPGEVVFIEKDSIKSIKTNYNKPHKS
jgi:amidophosphoribosyltransferase